jgi:phasin family protein
LDSLTQATRIAAEGATAVSKRQLELLQNALQQAAAMAREYKAPGSPGEAAAKQREIFTKAMETAFANARELAQMVEKSNREAFEVIQRRVTEGMEELRKSIGGNKQAGA